MTPAFESVPQHRRHLSPSAEMRVGEQMRVRLGLIVAMLFVFCAGAVIFGIIR